MATTGVCHLGWTSGGAGQERSVLGHGVIDARSDGDHGIHRGHQRQRHQRAEDAGDFGSEQAGGSEGSYRELAFHLLERSGVDEHQVQPEVQHGHQSGSDGQRDGQGAAGMT